MDGQALAEHQGGDAGGDDRQQVEEQRHPARPETGDTVHPGQRGDDRGEQRGVQHQRQVGGVQAGARRQQVQRQQGEDRHQHLQVEQLHGRQLQAPFLQQHAVHRIGQGGDDHHRVAEVHSMLQQSAEMALGNHQHHAGQRHQRAEQRPGVQPVGQDAAGQAQRHQGHQRQDDAHVGGAGQRRRVVGQALVDGHAEQAEDHELAEVGEDVAAVAQHRAEHEGRQRQADQQPAEETDLGGLDDPHGELVDDGVAGPDEHGQQGKQVLHGGPHYEKGIRGHSEPVRIQTYNEFQTNHP